MDSTWKTGWSLLKLCNNVKSVDFYGDKFKKGFGEIKIIGWSLQISTHDVKVITFYGEKKTVFWWGKNIVIQIFFKAVKYFFLMLL